MNISFDWFLGRHEGLNNEEGVYRVFDVPEGRNDRVVTHHRLLIVTVVAIITSLALTSTKSALWQEAQQNQVGSDCEWHELFVCHHKCQGLYTVTYRGGKAMSIDCTPNYGTDQMIVEVERLENNTVCDRITRERKCENKPKNLKVWSEALPEATCAWCIFLWLVTYPLLYMDRQYIQRLIYYMIVTSEDMAVCALLVRPVLIYMIPEFMICFFAILLLVLCLGFVLVYVDHHNHLD